MINSTTQKSQKVLKQFTIGVDLGGTTMSAGLVKDNLIVKSNTILTERFRSADSIIVDMVSLIESVADNNTIDAIGIGVPTPAGPETETFLPSDNIPALGGYPLKKHLSGYFGVPVALENDANCMTAGEYYAGALRGVKSGVCMTLGTGLGCGIIVNGALWRGNRYHAGEIWNLPFPEGKIIENTVSIESLKQLSLAHLGLLIEPHELFERYRAGDGAVFPVWHNYGQSVGRIAAIIISFFDPELLVIGGGIARAFKAFKDGMLETVKPVYGDGAANIILPAMLSENAAIIGAAMLAENLLNNT